MSKKLREYAFDVRLQSVVRVKAEDEDEARKIVRDMMEMDVMYEVGTATITEVSVDDPNPHLFELDGKEIQDVPEGPMALEPCPHCGAAVKFVMNDGSMRAFPTVAIFCGNENCYGNMTVQCDGIHGCSVKELKRKMALCWNGRYK